MCGAAAATDATHCEHCGARLATVACPSCFGMMFVGQQFCPHCGAKADRQDAPESEKPQPCPRCETPMESVVLGGSRVRECPKCEGIWTDADTLRQICVDKEKQAAMLGMPASALPSEAQLEEHIHYLQCPVCGDMMNRVNFSNFSGVIVDVCRTHGTWFDRDELRRIVEFIRSGGVDRARAREIANLEADRRLAGLEHIGAITTPMPGIEDQVAQNALSMVARFFIDLLVR
jgi:Zn-finger nucleic acid-binding protein